MTFNTAIETDPYGDADIAGMQRYFKTNCFSKGNLSIRFRRHSGVSALFG